MGLLKHAILPLYALLDAVLIYKSLILEDMEDIAVAVGRVDTSVVSITPVEQHLLHVLGAALLVLLLNNVAAIFVENSHYRGMAVLLNIVFFLVDAYSYVKMGIDVPPVLYAVVGMGLVGLIVHSKEPGIFTKDRKGGKGKSS